MKRIYTCIRIALLLCGFTLIACDVHEFPDEMEPEVAATTLNLQFDQNLPLYKSIGFEVSRAPGSDFDIRYIINIYEIDEDNQINRDIYRQLLLTKPNTDKLDHNHRFFIKPGRYAIIVWTDYVKAGETENLYYNTDDFSNIQLQGEYAGNTDLRDTFCGKVDVEISKDGNNSIDIMMSRPMAKFNFITTDLDQFEQKIAKMGGRSDDPNDLRIVFRYKGYLPSTYNAFTDRLTDSTTGIMFDAAISRLSNNEAELGFDYVFASADETNVQVAIEIYDKDNNFISSSPTISVPLKRGKRTTVSGNFLSYEATGGVGIWPEFDGEHNIVIE